MWVWVWVWVSWQDANPHQYPYPPDTHIHDRSYCSPLTCSLLLAESDDSEGLVGLGASRMHGVLGVLALLSRVLIYLLELELAQGGSAHSTAYTQLFHSHGSTTQAGLYVGVLPKIV
ncbi:hypothetical protein L210DRAFT_3508115 [Boletus edulis BED1]|uniref:Uncharacterized protein n=1 Tax=Boletus edulis BED1 TaxID=1328754 RepID=A0AAD4BHB7_BOLED|nr:hypothetical protein L210DRAFT_3508115 [Boletus edulis BED1]